MAPRIGRFSSRRRRGAPGKIGSRQGSKACRGPWFLATARVVAKPNCIQLPGVDPIPILFEDRSVLAIDKPAGWMLVPISWQKTSRNLQAAIQSSIAGGAFWARSRALKFLRHVHRLDGDTSGILLFAKSLGALNTIGDLFESRQMEKVYLVVTNHPPRESAWTCQLGLSPDPSRYGRIIVDPQGKPAETAFRVLAEANGRWLLEARPYTGRTHQIRVHLASAGSPVEGDELYGRLSPRGLALRAAGLGYRDPFTGRPITITADTDKFATTFGFGKQRFPIQFQTLPSRPPPARMPPERSEPSLEKPR